MKRSMLMCSACRLCLVPLGAALAVCLPARANPTGGQVVAGQATISNPNATTEIVGQTSERAVINWQGFSVAPGQITQFEQPNAQAVTLNRVTGSDLSTIAGQLRANGQVILINQSGIVFSQGSQVDTGGLIATTTDISTKSFVAGQTAFTVPSARPHASVVNRGHITVAQAGLAALVAPSVANSGVISATLGRVVLAGAQTFTADLYGDGLVSFDITSRVSQSPGPGGALVSNTGQITADGGHILLTADAVDGIIGDLVDAGGTLQAHSVGGRTGTIGVVGQGRGVVAVTGLLDASGPGAGQVGGTITVLGDRVGLLGGAMLDASGQSGGGLVLVGGNFHGKGPLQRARVTYVAPTAQVNVDALGSGTGGRAAIWSDQQTAYYGLISAQGGALGGSGGYVEVSGHNLDFAGVVQLASPHGRAGSLLLDPAIVNIDNNTSIPNQDNLLPTILASDDPGATDHILASAIQSALQNGNVSIAATSSINVNGTIASFAQIPSSLALTAPLITVGADITVQGDLTLAGAVTLDSASGGVNLSAGGRFFAGQISGANTLSLFSTSATLQGVNATEFFTSISTLQLESGTYTTPGQTLSFGTVTTEGSLVLGSPETDFAAIALAADTTLDARAAGGVVRVFAVDATTSYGQALTIATSGAGFGEVDNAGQTTPLASLTITGAAVLGESDSDENGVGINAGIVNIPGAITTGQTTTITTNGTGSITLGPVVGTGGDGGIFTSLFLTYGTGGATLHGFDEASFGAEGTGPLLLETGTYEIGGGSSTQGYSGVETSGTLTFAQSTSLGTVTLEGNTSFAGTLQPIGLTLTSLDAAGPYSATFKDLTDISSLNLGPVGASGPLAGLFVDIAGNTILDGNITAASVGINSPVLVQASVTVDASAGATFASVGTGGAEASLAFSAGSGNVSLGSVNLEGSLGILGTLSAASTASTVTLTGNVLAGAVDLAGPVAIAGSTQTTISTLDGENPGGPITLGPVSAPGDTLLLQAGSAAVSLSGFDLSEISVETSGQLSLHGGTYTTTAGTLSFDTVTTDGTLVLGSTETDFSEIILAADTRLDATASGGTINVFSVDATTAYGQGLAIATAGTGFGALYFVGETAPLSFLTATGNTVFAYGQPLDNDAFVTAGVVNIAGPFRTARTTFISTSDSGTITLGQALGTVAGDGSTGLTLSAGTGGITLNGVTEAGLGITSTGVVRLDAGDYVIGDGSLYSFPAVTTSGALFFGQPTSFGAVTLAADTAFQGYQAPVALSLASLDSASGSGPFSAAFTSNISQLTIGPVGASSPLSNLQVNIAGTTTLTGGTLAAAFVGVASPLLLDDSVTVDAPLGATFGAVDAQFGVSLAFSAGTGDVTLGPVGQAGPLESLIAASTVSRVTLNGDVSAGSVDLAGPVDIGSGDTVISTLGTFGSGPITLGSISGAGGTLTLDAGTSPISLSGFDLASIFIDTSGQVTLNTGTYTAAGTLAFSNVTTDGTLSFRQPTSFGIVTLAGDTSLDSSSVNGSLQIGPVNGGTFTLGVSAGSGDVAFEGVTASGLTVSTTGQETLLGGTYAIGTPVAGGVTAYDFGNVATSGTIVLGSVQTGMGSVLLGSDTLLETLGGGLALGPVSGGHALAIETGGGAVTLGGVIASSLSVTTTGIETLNGGTYALTGGGPLVFGDVTTNGTLFLPDPTQFGRVTLASDTTLDMTASSPLSLGQASGRATLTVIGGDVTFAGLTTSGFVSEVTGTETLTTGTYGLGGGFYAFGDVATAGTLTFEQPTSFASLSLLADTTLDSAGVGGALTLGPASGPFALSVEAGAGNVSLAGVDVGSLAIGSTGVLSLATGTYTVGTGTISLGGVTTAGTLSFGQPTSLGLLTLASDTVLATEGQAALSIGGATGGGFGLSVTAGQGSQPAGVLTVAGPIDGVGSLVLAGGSVALDAAIGAAVPVGSVSVDSLGSLAVAQPMTATADISLVAAGDLTIGALVSAAGTLLVTSGGTIAEQGQGSVQAGVLTGSAPAGSAIFGSAGNRIDALAGFTTGGDLLIDDAVPLTVVASDAPTAAALQDGSPAQSSPSQDVNAGGQVTLMDAASLSVDPGASIVAQTVSLGAFGGALSISGALAPSGDIYLAASGALSLGAGGVLQAGGNVRADAGSVGFAPGSSVSAGGDVWVGYGASANPVFAQYGFAAPSGVAGTVTEAAAITAGGNVGVQASGSIAVQGSITAGTDASGGNVFLTTLADPAGTPGDILVAGAISAAAGSLAGSGTVSLDAAGDIDEPGSPDNVPGSIRAAVLVGQSGGWASLGGANQVATLAGFQANGKIAATSDPGHQAGSSFTFNDASPLTFAAAPYSLISTAVVPRPSGALPAVTEAVSSGVVSGSGGVAIAAPGSALHLDGDVAVSSGSFVVLAGEGIVQTGTLTLSAPVSLLDVSGVPLAQVLSLSGADGSVAAAAFGSGHPRGFLNDEESLIGTLGSATATAPLQLADVAATNPGSNLILATDQAPISGTVDAAGLSVVSAGGSATLAGTIANLSGTQAARQGFTSFGQTQASQDDAVVFDACDLGAALCGVVLPPPAPPLAVVLNQPLQPQLVTDTGSNLGGAGSGLDPQQSQMAVQFFELLPFAEIQQEHAQDDIEVDRLDTGREDVQ